MAEREHDQIPNFKLKYEREIRDWTQRFVADRLGLSSKALISSWEHGKKFPRFYYRERLCSLFGKTAEELGLIPPERQSDLINSSTSSELSKRPPNNRLKYQRKLHGWTQSDVAFRIGTGRETVSRWERGERE